MKNNKGITLVALAVTITVLIILAGVSINAVIGDNGMIKKAQESVDSTNESEAKEIIDRAILEFHITKGYETLEDFLKNKVTAGTIDSVEKNADGTLNVSKNGYTVTVENKKSYVSGTGSGGSTGGNTGGGSETKVPEAATAETAPYFPDNTFTKKEGTIDSGLVIQDASGNEYVWVVVPKSLYNNTAYNSNNAKKPSSSTDYANIEYCLQQYTATYRNGTSYSDTYVADTANVGWFADETAYNNLKNSMLKSVYENGGFYVGRYEAGIGTNRTSDTEKNSEGKYITPSTAPVSKADAYPYTWVTRTQAQNLANNVNSGNKTSSLMFGVQWDLVLAFMSKDTKRITDTSILTSDSTTIGNYYNSTFDLNRGKYAQCGKLGNTWNNFASALDSIVVSNETTGKMKKTEQDIYPNGILLTTGGTEQSKVMNIYDIAGNVWEWTLEKTSDTDIPCASRGGSYDDSGSNIPAAYRDDYGEVYRNGDGGFRVSLF